MRMELMSRVKRGAISGLLPAMLSLAVTPAVWAATSPIVFAGLEQSPFGGRHQSTGVANDAAGNLYVSEPGNNRIRVVAPDGTFTYLTIAGLNQPRGIVVDASNNLWIANSGTGATTLTK